MDYLSSVNTILRIAQDFAAAVATVAKNNDRCKKLGERVQCIADLLRELHTVAAGTKMDAATDRVLGRLQKTLSDSLRLVRSWKKSSCPLNFINGGRMAEQFDEVERDIDRCLLDLGISNLILVARLEKQLHHQNEAASMETMMLRIWMRRDDNADNIKRCISSIQGVTSVSVAASTKDKSMVTVTAGAVDIPWLLNEVQEQLNCNVEVVRSAATSPDIQDHENEAKHKSAAMDERTEKRKQITSTALKKENATQTTMAAVNQQASEPYIYLPFKVELVPTDGTSSSYHVPYPYGLPSSHPIYTQRQDSIARRWREGENASAVGNVTAAIGVPLHTVTPGVPELVPQPSYFYGHWPYAHCQSTGGCCQNNATSPSTAYNYNQYLKYQDMFSDENPNAYCSIM